VKIFSRSPCLTKSVFIFVVQKSCFTHSHPFVVYKGLFSRLAALVVLRTRLALSLLCMHLDHLHMHISDPPVRFRPFCTRGSRFHVFRTENVIFSYGIIPLIYEFSVYSHRYFISIIYIYIYNHFHCILQK
jgi:hypothetical protein